MFIHYRTKGLVFKKYDYKEADQILTIYTSDFGKVRVLGKGIRKMASKLRSGTDIFCFSEIEFIQGRGHKILTDAIAIDRFNNIKRSLAKARIAQAICVLINDLVGSQEQDEALADLLREAFRDLNSLQIKNHNAAALYFYFFWHLVATLGYTPEFSHCVICQTRVSPYGLRFSFEDNGILCQLCFSKTRKTDTINITPETLRIVRIILASNWEAVAKIRINPEQYKTLLFLTKNYRRQVTSLLKKEEMHH